MDAVFLFVGIVVAITIGGLFLILGQTPSKKDASSEKIEGTDFVPSQMYMGSDGLGGLAVNERTHQICLIASPTSPARVLQLDDLVASYLIKNGELLGEGTRNQTQEISTFLQELQHQKETLISSLYPGGWSSEGNQRIDLIVVVRDEEDPMQVVNFLDMETKEGSTAYEKSLNTATHWHYVLDGLILQADQLSQLDSEATPQNEMAESAP